MLSILAVIIFKSMIGHFNGSSCITGETLDKASTTSINEPFFVPDNDSHGKDVTMSHWIHVSCRWMPRISDQFLRETACHVECCETSPHCK